MISDSGVSHIRLRGTNPQLAQLLPTLNAFGQRSTSFGSFLDEAVRFLASYRLTVMTLEYHAGTREVTLLVRG